MRFESPADVMQHAIALARRGIGHVEPNPPVGAVVVREEGTTFERLGEGWHEGYGGPHAEIHALARAGAAARGATLFVTLEPCCHHGKTPPCTEAVLAAGVRRVVVATTDPAPHVDGGGVRALRDAGLDVEVGVERDEAEELIAPFTMLQTRGRSWVHAKWAMTLDGRIATRTGHSRWISNDRSRARVHELRGRMDAVLVGAGTARADDPRLTARPPGPRKACRVVVDARASLSVDSRLVRTAGDVPVLVATTEAAPAEAVLALESNGVEVVRLRSTGPSGFVDVRALLTELGRRDLTHVLVEGGGTLLGSLFDAELIDEVHVFVAPKLVGGADGVPPIAGVGLSAVPQQPSLENPLVERLGDDVYLRGRVRR